MAETVFYVAAAVAAIAGAGTSIYAASRGGGGTPRIPPYKPPELPLPPPKKKDPERPAPGIEEKQVGAGALDERRRILAAMPQQTKNTYGGDASGDEAPVQKKRLLGGGIGRETTGV